MKYVFQTLRPVIYIPKRALSLRLYGHKVQDIKLRAEAVKNQHKSEFRQLNTGPTSEASFLDPPLRRAPILQEINHPRV